MAMYSKLMAAVVKKMQLYSMFISLQMEFCMADIRKGIQDECKKANVPVQLDDHGTMPVPVVLATVLGTTALDALEYTVDEDEDL